MDCCISTSECYSLSNCGLFTIHMDNTFILTFLNAFRKFSERKAYNTGLMQELVYAITCDVTCRSASKVV